MKCPRCNYEWDVRQSPCPLCHLHIRMPGRLGPVSLIAPAQEPSPDDIIAPPIDRATSDNLLHRNRYNLQKKLHRQTWPLDIVETVWTAVDTRPTQPNVIIYELSMPNDVPKEAHAIPYMATKVFTSLGSNSHIPALRDVFSDKDHNYFVFEAIEGSSLSTLMFNNGGKLPEQEVVACCLQIVELLNICSQQSPPLIHGNIRPEYIMKKLTDSQYILTNFSVALAGGLVEIIADTKDAAYFKQSTAESIQGRVNGRADLGALLEIAYYAVVGQWLSDTNALRDNSALSRPFHAMLSKGLLAPPHQRYQNPAQLYPELLLLHKRYKNIPYSVPPSATRKQSMPPPEAPMVQVAKNENRSEEFISPVPQRKEQPELVLQELSPLKYAHDLRNAALWFTGMLFLLILLLGRGLI